MEKNAKGKRFNKNSKEIEWIKQYVKAIIILIVFAIIFIFAFVKNLEDKYTSISEDATVDYKVYLSSNDFYEGEYRESNKQYVSSLISSIVTDFNYNLDLGTENATNYTYRIESTLNIIENQSNNSLYESTDILVEETTLSTDGNGIISINEELNIDYNEYNNTAKSFLTTYGLTSNGECTLDITLYVKSNNTEESTVTLSIPLAETTISIESQQNLVNQDKQILSYNANEFIRYIALVLLTICIVGIINNIRGIIRNAIESMDNETKYKMEKRKILMAYGEAIDRTDGEHKINFNEYCTIRLNKFADLLKIKETVSQPILMVENEEDTNTIFFIPSDTKFMYIFILGKETELLAEENKVNTSEYAGIEK